MHTLPFALDTGKQEGVDSPILLTAPQYAARRWKLIALHTPTTNGCSHLQNGCSVGKHPHILNGLNGASSDEVVLPIVGAQ
ncbi:hypothetical protein [Edaphobacter dinghuensis]|uniref:Uncharacterized protein n=1 Tax=Edaphobacter dinghuensis TaxID=1560005 RepID=A0A917HEY8_9BACT|nr:hypothetical protein [Edaphobacter dinghuensis]GGG75812.1 hypothetical protein GCM10011585_18350 [Edaphobacter dinghuensis]